MGRVSGFRLRIEQGNKLPFDNISPEDKWRGRIPLGLSKATSCLLTISVHVAASDVNKPNLWFWLSWIHSDKTTSVDQNASHWHCF